MHKSHRYRRSDSNKGSDYIAIFLSFITSFLVQHLKIKILDFQILP